MYVCAYTHTHIHTYMICIYHKERKVAVPQLCLTFCDPMDCIAHQAPLSIYTYLYIYGFPDGASGEEPTCQCRRHKRLGLIPESGRFPGGGNGNPLQYSCLENPMDREAWQVTVHHVTKSQAKVNNLACINIYMHMYIF